MSSVPGGPHGDRDVDQQPLASARPAEAHSDSTFPGSSAGRARREVPGLLPGQATPPPVPEAVAPRHPLARRPWRLGSFLRLAGGCPMVRGRSNV
jgi:hypothetical protein